MNRPFDCTVLPSDSLKKERLCLKIVLGTLVKHNLNFTVHHITRPVITLLQCGLDRHVDDNERYDSLQQRSFILYIHAVGVGQPLSK